ncbi:MAG: hypothetical protein JNK90_23280 [Planctomycetaceae bacterium]|nr:hypothetical protein [Planctomycetaceae bacterium]
MARRPKQLRQSAWDVENAKYADLSSPEWVLNYQVPAHFWKDLENHRRYVVWLGRQLGIQQLDDWYQYTALTCFKHRGRTLLVDHYDGSLYRLLREVFPKHNWLEWRFTKVSKHFWQSRENVLRYIEWFEKEVGIQSKSDWYNFENADIESNYGGGLLTRFEYGFKSLLKYVYPEENWLEWKFIRIPVGYWNHLDNRLRYLRWLGKTLGFKKIDDWYELKRVHFIQNCGETLLTLYYDHDLFKPLAELFPGYEFYPWMFDRVPDGYWDKPENCRTYLEWLAEQLGFTELEQWYDVVLADFNHYFGKGYMQRFNTPYQALQFAYPDHEWLPWRFERVPQGFWEDREQVNRFMQWLGTQLGVQHASDWNSINCTQIAKIPGGHGLLIKYRLAAIRKMGVEAMQTKRSSTIA